MLSLIKRLEEKVHPAPMREKIAQAIYRLSSQREKLDHMSSKLHQRDQELFQRCIGAQVAHDTAHARMYANECAELRNIAKIVLSSQLAIEQAVLRLQTIEEFGDIGAQMAPVLGVVKQTHSQLAGVVPQVAGELESVNGLLSDLSVGVGQVNSTTLVEQVTNEEAKQVLEESGAVAEQRLREKFPDLPNLEPEKTSKMAIAVPDGGQEGQDMPLENLVLGYLKSENGHLDVHVCAEHFSTSPDRIKEALEKLRREGRVVIE